MVQNTVILFGGDSQERLVSTATAQNISLALPEAKCWFWGLDNFLYEVSKEELAAHRDPFRIEFKPSGLSLGAIQEILASQTNGDLFLVAVHGGLGEDGSLQSWFEKSSLLYVGSDSKACQLCMNKSEAKHYLNQAGFLISESKLVSGQDFSGTKKSIKYLLDKHQRLAMKPNFEGSSIGYMTVTHENHLQALDKLTAEPERVFVLEAFIEGVELSVGVIWHEGKLKSLTPIEMRSNFTCANYEGKYLGDGLKEILPAEISEFQTKQAQEMALAAHKVLGCYGYSRSDMFATKNGIVYLETNSLPGLTKASLVTQQLEYAGISMRDFLLEQLELARERFTRKI